MYDCIHFVFHCHPPISSATHLHFICRSSIGNATRAPNVNARIQITCPVFCLTEAREFSKFHEKHRWSSTFSQWRASFPLEVESPDHGGRVCRPTLYFPSSRRLPVSTARMMFSKESFVGLPRNRGLQSLESGCFLRASLAIRILRKTGPPNRANRFISSPVAGVPAMGPRTGLRSMAAPRGFRRRMPKSI